MQISQRHHRLQKVEIQWRSRRRFYFEPQPQFSLPYFSDDKEAVIDVFGVFTLIVGDAFEGEKSNEKRHPVMRKAENHGRRFLVTKFLPRFDQVLAICYRLCKIESLILPESIRRLILKDFLAHSSFSNFGCHELRIFFEEIRTHPMGETISE